MNILRNVEMLKNLIQMICTWGKLLVINILPPRRVRISALRKLAIDLERQTCYLYKETIPYNINKVYVSFFIV